MSLIQDITFFSGDTAPIDVTLSGVNLTGATVRFFMRSNPDSTVNIIFKDTTSGITVTDPAAGKFTFTLSAAQTATLKGSYYYEIEVVDALANVTTVTTGTITAEVGRVVLSYATVDYADAYFDNVLFPEPWTSTAAATKEKALRMATKKIDSLMLIGRRVDPSQPLEFPRSIYSDTDTRTLYNGTPNSVTRFNYGPRWIDEPEVSQEVKEAACEEALALLRGGIQATKRAELQRQGITSFSLGSLSESYSGASSSPNKLISVTASQLLSRYVGGSRTIV